jgi:hypothetical protein
MKTKETADDEKRITIGNDNENGKWHTGIHTPETTKCWTVWEEMTETETGKRPFGRSGIRNCV